MSESTPTILYCHCQYAQVVPKEVKETVLRRLCDAGIAFEAVADLCEMSARKDPALARLAASGGIKIAACYPRAVKWLFASANAPLPVERTEVLNMRTESADAVTGSLFSGELSPNLPTGKVTVPARPDRAPIDGQRADEAIPVTAAAPVTEASVQSANA
jgi:hypothetical protein